MSQPALESLYDMVTTEISAPDDGAVYSILNFDITDTSIEKLYSLSDEHDSGTCAIYPFLEIEEPEML